MIAGHAAAPAPSPGRAAAAVALLLSLAALVGLLGLGALHPLWGAWTLAPLAAVVLLAWRWPDAWPAWLLPSLPLAGWAPWTGSMGLEELDLLVLAALAGGYARRAVRREPLPAVRTWSGAGALLLGLYLVAMLLSAWRGWIGAGGGLPGWWQGFHEPMNTLRLSKSLPLAMLLLPLWLDGHARDPQRAARILVLGMAGLGAVVGVLVAWERLAYTGLTDFSSDYRVSALFWEMHVGGAALDAALALALPFSCAALAWARTAWGRAIALGAVLLVLHSGLATFSRIVYLALPLGLGLWWLLARRAGSVAWRGGSIGQMVAFVALFAVLAIWLFPVGGYRGLLALVGVFALAWLQGGRARRLGAGQVGLALLLAVVVAGVAATVGPLLPRGPYVLFALVVAAGGVLSVAASRSPARAWPVAELGLLFAACAGLALVVVHWSGAAAIPPAWATAGVLAALALLPARSGRALWTAGWASALPVLAALALVGLLVGVFLGGAYMSSRWSAATSDVGNRGSHLERTASMLHGTADWVLGRGVGRYPAAHFEAGGVEERTGDFRWREVAEGRLVLTSGRHLLGAGQLFRLTQRIPAPDGPVRLRVRVRTPADTSLFADVCAKHLLYPQDCVVGERGVAAHGGEWQTVEWALEGDPPSAWRGGVPRFIAFTLAPQSPGARVEIDRIELLTVGGRDLLRNGDFRAGMTHWFFTSDRHHMPWHAKNIGAHLVLEQGLLGAVLVLAMFVAALWRTTRGALRHHPLAPALAAALAAVLVVGLVDSVVDAPRLALLLYVLLGAALLLPAAGASAGNQVTRVSRSRPRS